MKRSILRQIALPAIMALASSTLLSAQKTDYNEVGKQVSVLLQNNHFSDVKWNKDLSGKFLDTYLRELDPRRMYFLQSDIDRFKTDYAPKLHDMLLRKTSITAAEDIYQTYISRAKESMELVNAALKESFDFTKNETIAISRKDAPWPKDEASWKQLWHLNVKDAVLSETLRREQFARLAIEQGKADPLAAEKPPLEIVRIRYQRKLRSITDADSDAIATRFLAAVSSTLDPHSLYMNDRQNAQFDSQMKNQFVGIGVEIRTEDDGATVIKGISVGGPAEKQGELKLNDRIVGVDSQNTGHFTDILFMSINQVSDLIRGEENTPVRLKVEPSGGAPGMTKMITITRGQVETKSEQASAEIIEKKDDKGIARKLGWITLPSFYGHSENRESGSATHVEKLLIRLMDEKIDGLVIDLRGNGGGSLPEVCRMAGLFIKRGPVVQIKKQLAPIEVIDSQLRAPVYQGPLIILIDKTSASASEILAGALQDHNRAIIVGDSSSYGKGTVQEIKYVAPMMPFFAYSEKAGTVKVTIKKFYRPSGESTQIQGVRSDIVLPSIYDSPEFGEGHWDNCLSFDTIRKAPGLAPLDRNHLFLPRLQELSAGRTQHNIDLIYTREDIAEMKKLMQENKSSLNKSVREQEYSLARDKSVTRNKERMARFDQITQEDRRSLAFYRVTLDDLAAKKPLTPYDPTKEDQAYMRRAKDITTALDDTPKWPSGMDYVKRESLNIVVDLAQMTENARIAGMLKKNG